MTLVFMVTQTVLFAIIWSAVHLHVKIYGPVPGAQTFTRLNNRAYSIASLLLLCLILHTGSSARARKLYHLSKFYEYLDILGVRCSGGVVSLHFAVHHLTTPYMTYFRVLQHNDKWQVVASLNAIHHVFMYAYFGGTTALRRVLPLTGTLQLVVGCIGEAAVLYRKSTANESPVWPNVFTLSLLCLYFVLWLRELRSMSSARVRVTEVKAA